MNGFFTVIGTVITLILGMAFGFRIVLTLVAFCYLIAWAAVARTQKDVDWVANEGAQQPTQVSLG